MTLTDLLRGVPPSLHGEPAREELRRSLTESGSVVAVVDDDPTGTQTVHDVWVTTDLGAEALEESLRSPEPVFYISTNSRSLPEAECRELSLELGRELRAASSRAGKRVILASRSDSTLRGHFPVELQSLCRGLGRQPSGCLLVPAFFEGGRYTASDIHWVAERGQLVRASDTEFARDPTFGYHSSDLKQWIEEKSRGAVRADEVATLSLELIRTGGSDAVSRALREACASATSGGWGLGRAVVVNAACYEDLDVVAQAVASLEAEGVDLVYRCAASFVKSRGGFTDQPLLTGERLIASPGAGLVVMGSYVDRSTRQLERLLRGSEIQGVEADVDALADGATSGEEARRVAVAADGALRDGRSAAIYTTRSTHLTRREGYLSVGRAVMRGLCDAVRRLEGRPSWVIAKGGITSIEIARSALGIRRARVLGQVAKGVPVWGTGAQSRLPGVPYVVFPGNVGEEEELATVVAALEGRDRRSRT